MTCKRSRACQEQSRGQSRTLGSSHLSCPHTAFSSKPEPAQPRALDPGPPRLSAQAAAAGLHLPPTRSPREDVEISLHCAARHTPGCRSTGAWQVRIPGPGHMGSGKAEENRRGSQGLGVKQSPLPQSRRTKPGHPGGVGQRKGMKP